MDRDKAVIQANRHLASIGLTGEQCTELAKWLRYRAEHIDGQSYTGIWGAAEHLEAVAPYIEFPQRHATGMGTP